MALVGRPNVGKSALFNRMLGGRKALVEDIAGTTRDRLYGDVEWQQKEFRLVDTGGLLVDESAPYSALIRQQVELAIEEAQVILFVVDAKEGITAADLDVADVLRRAAKPVLLLANKAENWTRREAAVEFYELGLGEPIPVSAYHGQGVADVLDMVVELAPAPATVETEEALSIAIVGRPNVGKSMLLNAILGEERVIVSDEPGTTRDSIDTLFEFQGQSLLILDTAGIRRRGRVQRGVEKHSVLRAERAVEKADVAFLLMDAAEGVAAAGHPHRRPGGGRPRRVGAGGEQVGLDGPFSKRPQAVREGRAPADALRSLGCGALHLSEGGDGHRRAAGGGAEGGGGATEEGRHRGA